MRYTKSLGMLAAVASLFAAAGPYAAEWKPEKPVELVVPAAPGGGTDFIARTVQKIATSQRLIGLPMQVVNKPGGAGSLAFTYIAQHRGNPHFVSVTYPSLLTNHIVGTSPLRHSEFTSLALLRNAYMGFAVRADSPLKTPKDLLDRVRKDPQSVVFSTFALGGPNHLALVLVMKAAGVDVRKLKVVVFASGGESQTALLGGHVDVVPTGLYNLRGPVQDGRLRVLAITAPKRSEGVFAQVPTWKENGIDAVMGQWFGIIGPQGMTAAHIAFWDEGLARVVQTDEWKAELQRNAEDNEYLNSRDSRRFLDQQYDEYRRILAELGLAKQ
ncbi:MAG: tripartite tricarboxylate transporter substrate binding protein [Betaproteobacteria bacterium]|nr:tripartite tricarboxylate transporter substrate binding protein [Betaproteobacteria bacterium]